MLVAPEDPSNKPVAGRYELVRLIGCGAHGEVWEATDRLAGVSVAVKLLKPGRDFNAARVRREIAALRLLRIPGVVQLLDEGMHGDQAFLVMELATGLPFPGAAGTRSWAALAETATGLLETLARVHAAGVLHRDLKPANVLVDADGRPTILDFGLSRLESPVADGPTEGGDLLGTPAYIAPELLSGELATPRVDLYAVGVMLFHALTGRLPFDAWSSQDMIRAKLAKRPTPVRDVVPEVPVAVAAVVDRLLSRDPADRPRSAADVLGLLRGERPPSAGRLPWLGSRAPIDAIVAAAEAGRSIAVRGPRGAGRSRCLEEAAEALAARGRAVAFAVPAGPPFASLAPIVGALEELAKARLSEVARIVEERVRAALAAGTVIVVDDVDRLDRQSIEILDAAAHVGAILRSSPDAAAAPAEDAGEGAPVVRLAPLPEEALRPLFRGPDRLLHLQEDGARALFGRTAGVPARVADEVAAWVRAGLARWDEGRLAIDREILDGLAAGLHLPGPTGVDQSSVPLPHRLDELLAWISLAWPDASRELVAAAKKEPLWRVEAEVQELVARGAARIADDDRVEPMQTARIDDSWSSGRRIAAHRSVAELLPPGHPSRLLHLVAGDAEHDAPHAGDLAREARTLALRLAEDGHLGRAAAVLLEGVRAARRTLGEASPEVLGLLGLWVEVAIADATPRALDRVLYEICRAEPREGESAHLEALVRAALGMWMWTDRTLANVEAVLPFDDAALERRRRALCVAAARRSRDREEDVVADAEEWAERTGDPDSRAALAGWLGRVRYLQGRFGEAAALHAEAAASERWITARISARLNGASALMEAFRPAEAASIARDALALARGIRHAAYEARSEWILRCTAYRTGAATAPDLELCDAMERIGAPELEPMVYLNEAAVAWRASDPATSIRLARRARQLWAPSGEGFGSLLAWGLMIACGDDLSEVEAGEVVASARACRLPRVALQVLGLVGSTRPLDEPTRHLLTQLAEAIPPNRWDERLEILSAREALGER